MTAGCSAEHDELRQLVRGFLQEKSPSSEVRRLMEADRSRDDAVIQIHGGIGYTWERDAHLYLRRAKSSQLLFGPPVQGSRWLHGFLRTRASTIGAGTREIQLNTVAEQLLGLPHDPGMPPR
jgi:alkylation response protein AidB-like acyl-CoA dehydrogenase